MRTDHLSIYLQVAGLRGREHLQLSWGFNNTGLASSHHNHYTMRTAWASNGPLHGKTKLSLWQERQQESLYLCYMGRNATGTTQPSLCDASVWISTILMTQVICMTVHAHMEDRESLTLLCEYIYVRARAHPRILTHTYVHTYSRASL